MAENSFDAFSKCALNLKVEDDDSGIPASALSLVLFDSIHNIFPIAKLYFNDYTGIYHEYMAFINGIKVEVFFGLTTENWKKCPYIVVKNSEPAQVSQNGLGGQTEIALVHESFYKQKIDSASFDSNISDIISDLTGKYGFESTDIDSTSNSGLWFQPYLNDFDFIKKILMPYAYSADSEDSPFYCFITSDNGFHFKSYKKLMEQNPVKEYKYRSLGADDSLTDDSILTAVPVQIPVSDIRPYYNRTGCYWDENGEFTKEENIKLADFPKGATDPIPVKADLDLMTGIYQGLDDDFLFDDNKNNRFGQKINPVIKAISPEKLVISVRLNRELCSGKIIKLNFPTTEDNNSSELSLRSSDNYLIESCYHKWTGKDAITICVCTKQTVKVNGNYRNNSIIISR